MKKRIPSQIGMKYNRLTIVEEIFEPTQRVAVCKCDCGNMHRATTHKVRTGHTKSCGCFNIEKLKRPRLESQVGQRYGRLVVLEDKMMGGVKRKVIARCDCGKEIEIKLHSIRTGNTSSCGCIKREMLIDMNTKHSMSYTSEYHCWGTMIQRCTNPNNSRYAYYGRRGIKVCDDWLKFENFIRDMGLKPSADLSIDRIDNNGNYCKENCRWADRFTQMNNTRKNKKVACELH
jgi:hypothetical protein